MIASLALAVDCSNSRATPSGERASSSPRISSVGTGICGSRSRWSASAIAVRGLRDGTSGG
jgi:hypothetical protein